MTPDQIQKLLDLKIRATVTPLYRGVTREVLRQLELGRPLSETFLMDIGERPEWVCMSLIRVARTEGWEVEITGTTLSIRAVTVGGIVHPEANTVEGEVVVYNIADALIAQVRDASLSDL